MSDQINDLDIFILPPPPPADSEKTIALRAEVDKLRTHLTNMIQLAPSEHDDEHIPEKEEWCQNFFNLQVHVFFPLSVL